MKLKELIKVLAPDDLVDFEIREETYPQEIYVKDILGKFPHAQNFDVVLVGPAFSDSDTFTYAKLYLEVTNEMQEENDE